MIIVIMMMMMTVMVMSISRLVGRRFPTAEFKTTVLCQARHTTSLTSCHIERWSSSLPLFPLFFWVSARWQAPVTVLQKTIHRWQCLLLSPSWSISLCLFSPSLTILYIWAFCLSSEHFVFPLHLSTLLHLHPSPLNMSPSLSPILCSPMG